MKLTEYKKTTDPTRKTMLEQELYDTQSYLNETISNNDLTHNVTLAFMICNENLNEMKEIKAEVIKQLRSRGFKTSNCNLLQEETLRMMTPVLNDGKMPSEIRKNYGFPLPSKGVAGLYPFVFETLKDNQGFLFGQEMQNGGMIFFDQHFYKHQPQERVSTRRVNGNALVAGTSGMGKTVACDLICQDHVVRDSNIVYVDPENKIERLIKMWQGQYVVYGVRGNVINPFDLRPISNDSNAEDEYIDYKKLEAEKWDTKVAINKVVGDINQIIDMLSTSYSDNERAIMGKIVRLAFAEKGFKPDENGIYHKSFKGVDSDSMPTFSDTLRIVNTLIEELRGDSSKNLEYDALYQLKFKLDRICNEWGVYLDGHTTIKLDPNKRKRIAFGIKDLQNVADELKEALNFIIYQYAWSLCIDNDYPAIFVLDEAHVSITDRNIAKFVAQFARRGRKYNTCLLIALQEPKDFCASEDVIVHSKAIFNNCIYKIIMGLSKDAVDELSKLLSLNENEKLLIEHLEMGQALFEVGNRRIPINVIPSQQELESIGN